jgi:hypothetical protein
VNLGGGGWPSHFYAGGEIYRAGADIFPDQGDRPVSASVDCGGQKGSL